ncbi:MAG: branched-chain amino acid transport system permease protein [Acidimicrobiaceae bacterium]|nr:branched-chain amino acid transport system permease protein [Acidimicrobiaceae bacterium]
MPRLRNLNMTLRYEDDLKLFKSRQSRLAMVALAVVAIALPLSITDDFWLSVLNYAGITAVGAIGLNLLTGYTGQVSLGHAFFLGVGAYSAVFFGGTHQWPLPLWLLACAVMGGLIGAVVGPFALRLRGNYLAVVSLGLVFLGIHVFTNWDSVTGGPGGTSVAAPLKLGPINFGKLEVGNYAYTRNQGFFLLVWAIVAISALFAKNIVRTRPGRAMQAVRDRDVAAEVIGVSLARYKVGAFVISSALAAVAGGLFGAYQQFVTPESWNLFLSIQYIAIIIVGGVGTIFGSILGAMFIGAAPQIVDKFSGSIPLVSRSPGGSGFHLTVFQLNQVIFGVLIVLFLVLEPRGLAAVWLRLKAYFRAWPFSY